MTQNDQILNYMKQHGSITVMEGFMELDITKVPTRISEMIMAGVKIDKVMMSCKKPDGTVKRYMRYFLVEE